MTHDPSPLVGLAVGDALGMPFETAEPTDERLLAWDGSYQASEYHKLRPGQWTDDTMMSLCLAESLCDRQGYDPVDVAAAYLRWYASGDFRGMGHATREALGRLASGASWETSGVQGAEGNGTAMRVGVLGAFYRRMPDSAAEFAKIDAAITHVSDEAQVGSTVIARAVALLASGLKKELLVQALIRATPAGSKIRNGLAAVRVMEMDHENAEDVLGERLPTKAHVVQTVPAAIAAFVLTEDYISCVHAAIRAGGDTDTTAAIAGGLAGAHYGLAAIPEELRSKLESYERLRRVELDLMRHNP